VKLAERGQVLLELFDVVVERDVVAGEEGVDLHAGAVAEDALDVGFSEVTVAVGVDEEGFEGGAGGVDAGGAELVGEGVRDVEGDLHGGRVHLSGLPVGLWWVRMRVRAADVPTHDGGAVIDGAPALLLLVEGRAVCVGHPPFRR
jgi:hypothetical protein